MTKNRTFLVHACWIAAVLLAASLVSSATARSVGKDIPRSTARMPMKVLPSTGGNTTYNAVAAASTTYLASYTFNAGASCVTQGWTTVDLTAQTGDYVHVDDFAGLGGGNYGLLVPITGAKSLWIGARVNAADQELCGYAALPGYGNAWQQILCSDCFTLSGDATLTYNAVWDSEPGFDYTHVEIDAGCTGIWTEVTTANAPYNAQGSGAESITITAATHGGSARVRFNFSADGAWSDSDGLWDTDGAFIVDNLRIVDGVGVKTNQTFETESVGAHVTADGHWQSCNLPGFGNFAALLPGAAMLQEDPCARDLSCMWTFITGSTANYACGGFPGVTALPFGNDNGQYLTNEVWSPLIPWTGAGNEALLEFSAYRDLPADNLIRFVWHIRSIVGGCAQGWQDEGYVYYGEDKDWLEMQEPVGLYVDPAATHVQIAVGVWDMCPYWCGTVGSGACHSHAPMFDNIRLKRIETSGPQWSVTGFRLFQDNFASDGTVTGTVRADMVNDLLPTSNPGILPGDSAAATVVDPVNGIATDPGFGGAAVYAYVKVSPTQAAKSGAALSDDLSRWPMVGTTLGPDGDTWTILRFDTAYVQNNQTPVADAYCVDLNDNLFTPGDTVEYFYAAESGNGARSYFFHQLRAADNADAIGAVRTSTDINVAYANPAEMTCLPAAALNNGGDILYVDDGDGRAVQPFFDQAFHFLGIYDKVDRYDVVAPSSHLGNGPGARVVSVSGQILPYYKKILWNSEELEDGSIGDGSGQPDKGDDMALLYAFLDQSTQGPGLYISGDGIPGEWASSGAGSAVDLRSVFLNFNVVTTDHKTVGLGVTPKAIATAGSFFDSVVGPDTLIAYGGCFGINRFDVLQATGSAVAQMNFAGNPLYAAVVSQETVNGAGQTARVVLEGFSYDLIRDDRAGANGGVMDRVDHLYDIITWLQNPLGQPTGAKPNGYKTTLAQNYPNPFNPSTTIEFTVRDRSRVSLNVYNVAGQLVRTLVNEDRAPGTVHTVAWDGRNDAGQSVSSGVYFYKLVTSDMTQTRKMVLLK